MEGKKNFFMSSMFLQKEMFYWQWYNLVPGNKHVALLGKSREQYVQLQLIFNLIGNYRAWKK